VAPVATVYGVQRVATAVWTISPALVLALDEHLGPPVDSYVNGSQTWLAGDEAEGDLVLELRLHPVASYRTPAGASHYDVWESVVAQMSAGADPAALHVGTEVRPLASFWDGLESFTPHNPDVEPPQLAQRIAEVFPNAPDRLGLVDHEHIADQWERAGGNVSIVALLIEELSR
jgi:hypothetical protein